MILQSAKAMTKLNAGLQTLSAFLSKELPRLAINKIGRDRSVLERTASTVFAATVFTTCAVHIFTLTRSPLIWQDEVQIVEYGRTLMPGSEKFFGANWSASNKPLQAITYLGTFAHEMAYRGAKDGSFGPRIAALVGAVSLTFAMRAWLLQAGISSFLSAAIAICVLWDPCLAQGYRGARVDALAIAFMISALWCIRVAANTNGSRCLLAIAGVLAAMSALTWPSAILLGPLLVYEIWNGSKSNRRFARSFGKSSRAAAFVTQTALVASSAALALMVLIAPLAILNPHSLSDLFRGVSGATSSQTVKLIQAVWQLPLIFLISPFLPLVAVAGAAIRGPRSWLIPAGTAALGVIITTPYIHRAVYLLPYFAYAAARTIDRIGDGPSRASNAKFGAAAILAMLCWSGGVSIIARPAFTLQAWHRRDPELTVTLLASLPGGPGTTVLLETWELYYAVRSRGWHYWGPYDDRSPLEKINSVDYDYVIRNASYGLHPLDAVLRARGYSRTVISATSKDPDSSQSETENQQGYGPYLVYAKGDIPVTAK